MNDWDNGCLHDYKSTGKRYSTGKNLIGVEVTAYVEDLQCNNCGCETIKILESDPKYNKNI